PFDAWLLLRGLKTLPIRMDRHSENAEKIVEKLIAHPKVKNVYYPSLDESGIYAKQMTAGGGVIAFDIAGDKAEAQKLLNDLSFVKVAASLGDVESINEDIETMKHAVIYDRDKVRK